MHELWINERLQLSPCGADTPVVRAQFVWGGRPRPPMLLRSAIPSEPARAERPTASRGTLRLGSTHPEFAIRNNPSHVLGRITNKKYKVSDEGVTGMPVALS
jgi:hypothetical protein